MLFFYVVCMIHCITIFSIAYTECHIDMYNIKMFDFEHIRSTFWANLYDQFSLLYYVCYAKQKPCLILIMPKLASDVNTSTVALTVDALMCNSAHYVHNNGQSIKCCEITWMQ